MVFTKEEVFAKTVATTHKASIVMSANRNFIDLMTNLLMQLTFANVSSYAQYLVLNNRI